MSENDNPVPCALCNTPPYAGIDEVERELNAHYCENRGCPLRFVKRYSRNSWNDRQQRIAAHIEQRERDAFEAGFGAWSGIPYHERLFADYLASRRKG